MSKTRPSLPSTGTKRNPLQPVLSGSPQFLTALFDSSSLGFAILDRRLRYQAINHALASIHGLPSEAHLGKPLRRILGKLAQVVEPQYRRVFETGQSISNFRIVAQLPGQDEEGEWLASYFPIDDSAGKTQHVGAIILQVTGNKRLEQSLANLVGKLRHVEAALRLNLNRLGGPRCWPDEQTATLSESIHLLEECLSEAHAIHDLLAPPPPARPQNLVALPQPPLHGESNPSRPDAGSSPAAGQLPGPQKPWSDLLSPREQEIVRALAESYTNKQIAGNLGISVRTVETHRARIMLKLDLHSLSDLVRYAIHEKIVQV